MPVEMAPPSFTELKARGDAAVAKSASLIEELLILRAVKARLDQDFLVEIAGLREQDVNDA